MNRENVSKIKSEDKKAFGKFVLIIVLSAIAGGCIGIGLVFLQKKGADALADLMTRMFHILNPYGIIVVTAVISLINTVIYLKGKRTYLSWDGENEEVICKIEAMLGYALWLTSINMILNFFLFSIGIGDGMFERYKSDGSSGYIIITTFGLIVGMVVITVQQQKIVNLEKLINPEKRGSIFDIKFKKKWEESCDEAEKFKMYQCGYKAYNSTHKVCMLLWFVCALCGMVWDIGIFPVLIVTVIWITLITSFCMEESKSNKKSNKKS